MLVLLIGLAFVGDPTLKGGRLYEDPASAIVVETQTAGAGTSVTMLKTPDGTVIASLNLVRETLQQSIARADFPTLGWYFEVRYPVTKPDDVLVSWWKNGVVSPKGADLAALRRYAADRGITLVNTAESLARMQKAAKGAPPPPSAPSSTAAPSPSSPEPAAPTVVSVTMRVSCEHQVRLFEGSSPTTAPAAASADVDVGCRGFGAR
jgi:hypothetical protein